MKKIFALLLALVMLLSLAACGKGVEESDVRGDQIENKNETPHKSESVFSMGKVNGLTYENRFIGIGCKLDSKWSFYSDEQIREMNNMTADMAGEEYQAAIQNANLVYDMYAVHENGVDNIIINLEKVNPLQMASLKLSDVFQSQLPLLKSSFENMGYTNITFAIDKATIGGTEFDALYTSADIGEYCMYQANLLIKCDGYLASVSITAFDEATLASLLSSFYLL